MISVMSYTRCFFQLIRESRAFEDGDLTFGTNGIKTHLTLGLAQSFGTDLHHNPFLKIRKSVSTMNQVRKYASILSNPIR